jgi:hypothetical protein
MADTFGFSYAANRALDRWGHYSPALLQAAILASIYLGVRSDSATAISIFVSIGLLLFVLLTWLQMRQHDRRLCETCAARIPLNPSARAARYRLRFRLAHLGGRPAFVFGYIGVLLGSSYFLLVPHGRWVWAGVQATMIYLISSHSTHRRLQPWCPWCSDSGGGDARQEPAPDLPRDRGRPLV